jgi:hypothetical protein
MSKSRQGNLSGCRTIALEACELAIPRIVSLALIALSIFTVRLQLPEPAWSATTISCGRPLVSDAEWQSSSPEATGFDPTVLCSLTDALDKSPEMNVHAVLVVRHGLLVYEHYRAGEDYKWGTKLGVISYTSKKQHDLRSISKSVVSLLVGIAVTKSSYESRITHGILDSGYNVSPFSGTILSVREQKWQC